MRLTIPRTPEQINSEINRIEGNIAQVRDGSLWSETEKEALLPIYEKQLKKLQAELDGKIKEIEVIDPEIL